MNGRLDCVWLYLVTLSALSVTAAQIHVPAEQPTIQQGINAAADGDTVLVAPGVYNEAISFNKDIVVISESGPQVTTIDAHRSNAVVTISGATSRSTRLQGFTIQNGSGGIYVSGGGPTIANNIIITNATCSGAGIYVSFSSPLIVSNVIAGNFLAGCSGGQGGGMYLGGAAAAEIVHNVITNNSTTGDGGGIECFAAGTPVIRENLIGWNTAKYGGGISMANYSDAGITNNVIVGNTATTSGGGIYALVPSGRRGPYVINNTIADNTNATGSGIYSDGYDKDSLIANNLIIASGSQTALYVGSFNDPNQPIILTNDLYSPGGSAFGGLGTSPVGTNGNVSLNPQFLDPAYGDYRLRTTSPVIDAGSNLNAPTNDFDGVVRPYDGNSDGTSLVDLGAYEWIPRPPPAPRNLAGLSVGLQTFLSWRASPEATAYDLKRALSSGGPYTLLQEQAGTNFTDASVVSNVVYFYVVTATNIFGEGSNSVEISVKAGNASPAAVSDSTTTPEDTPVEVAVTNNDNDPNYDSLSVASVLSVTNGTVIITNNAAVRYTPGLNFNGVNYFKYVVTDGRGAFSTGQVSVVVAPVNDAPVALTSTLNVPGDSAGFTIILSGSDVDGDPLTFQAVTLPARGILNTNTFIYRPAHGFVGNDPFTYQAFDGHTNSTPRTLTLRVLAQTDSNADKIPDAWAALYGIASASADDDLDGLSNLQEYLANTNPHDTNSALRLFNPALNASGQPLLSWPSVGGTRYRVQAGDASSLGAGGSFNDLVRSASVEMDPAPNGTASTMSFTDTNSLPASGARLYRIKTVTQ